MVHLHPTPRLNVMYLQTQVEAAFTNYFYRASPKDSIISEASDMKSSLSGSPEEKLLQEDPENPNGNFSDIFVCHGTSAPNLLFILHERV